MGRVCLFTEFADISFVLEECNGILDDTEKSTLIGECHIVILPFLLTANRRERFTECDGMYFLEWEPKAPYW
jgi:hypothetical protein